MKLTTNYKYPLAKLPEGVIERHGLEPWHTKLLAITMLPKALRPHRSQVCAQLNISESIYYYWLRHPKFNDARKELIKQYYFDDVPDILMAMKNEAFSGNERAARLFLEFVADFRKEEERAAPFERPDPLPTQEINVIINNLEQKFYGDRPKQSELIEGQTEPSI